MCKDIENHMVQPWADDEPIPEPEEMDPDEERELYGSQTWYDLKEIEEEGRMRAKEVTEEVMRDFDKIIDIIKKDYGGRDDPE
jgi:hypothetical protein